MVNKTSFDLATALLSQYLKKTKKQQQQQKPRSWILVPAITKGPFGKKHTLKILLHQFRKQVKITSKKMVHNSKHSRVSRKHDQVETLTVIINKHTPQYLPLTYLQLTEVLYVIYSMCSSNSKRCSLYGFN